MSDTNVILDFEVGGLVASLFTGSLRLVVPDVLWERELRQRRGHLIALGLRVQSLVDVTTVVALARRHRKPSRADLFALAVAMDLGCVLLTGDSALREAAEAEGCPVHGTLWLAEQLLEQGVLAPGTLRNGYALMKRSDRRLPWDLVDKQLLDLGLPSLP